MYGSGTKVVATHYFCFLIILATIKKCPKITCPPGYKEIHPERSKSARYHSYLSPMFSKYGRKTYSGIKSRKSGIKTIKKNQLERPEYIKEKKVENLEEKCPEIQCLLPPPPFPSCPPISCPTGFVPELTGETEVIKGKRCTK